MCIHVKDMQEGVYCTGVLPWRCTALELNHNTISTTLTFMTFIHLDNPPPQLCLSFHVTEARLLTVRLLDIYLVCAFHSFCGCCVNITGTWILFDPINVLKLLSISFMDLYSVYSTLVFLFPFVAAYYIIFFLLVCDHCVVCVYINLFLTICP